MKLGLWLLLLTMALCSCRRDRVDVTPTVEQTSQAPSATATVTMVGDLGWGQVRGVVRDAVNDRPIEGAQVTCVHFSYSHPESCSGTRTTDENGLFLFEEVFFHDTDRITLTVEAAGYLSQSYHQDFFTMVGIDVVILLDEEEK